MNRDIAERSTACATTVDDCRVIELPRIVSEGGSITPIEEGTNTLFPIERIFYLYDIPGGAARGGHAHKALQQLIIAPMGAYDVVLDDGIQRRTVRLDRAHIGLYVPPMIWGELGNFSTGAICMVLASMPYEEADYIRDYDGFRRARGVPLSRGLPLGERAT
jgi:hypothetical protein